MNKNSVLFILFVTENAVKQLNIILIAFCAVLFLACGKEKDAASIVGSWEMCDYQTKSVTIGEQSVTVIVAFSSDGTFTLYQKTGSEMRFAEYSGSWTLAGDMLSGKYEDGSPWASTYTAELSEDRLTLISSTVPAEVMTFTRTEI